MSASLQKRTTAKGVEQWRCFVYLHAGPGGKRSKCFAFPHTGEGKRLALAAAAEFELAVRTESGVSPRQLVTELTVGDVCEAWLAHASPGWQSVRTVERNRRELDIRILPHPIAAIKAAELTATDIDRFYTHLRTNGATTRGRLNGEGLSAATIAITHGVLRAAFNHATNRGWTRTNPLKEVKAPSPRNKPVEPPTPEQARLIITAATGPVWSAYARLGLETGARVSNLLGVRWRDLDLTGSDPQVTFLHGVTSATGQPVQVKSTKSGRPWSVSIGQSTVEALELLREERETTAKALGAPMLPAGSYVFHGRPHNTTDTEFQQRPMKPAAVKTWWHRLRLQQHGALDGITLHSWRHFAASQMLAAGVDIMIVANRLGHKDPAVTLRVYGHLIPAKDRDASDIMNNLLDSL